MILTELMINTFMVNQLKHVMVNRVKKQRFENNWTPGDQFMHQTKLFVSSFLRCTICEYKSNRSDNVLFHLRKVHKIDKPTKDEHVLGL